MKITILLMGLFGLFAQVFGGHVIPGVLISSLSAIALALLGIILNTKFILIKWVIILLSMGVMSGSAYDVFDYYSHPHSVGNSYGAWIWSIPLCICVAIYAKQLFRLVETQHQP